MCILGNLCATLLRLLFNRKRKPQNQNPDGKEETLTLGLEQTDLIDEIITTLEKNN